ncbi:MAG: aminodeoxychorismate synthase component I [Chloroherpetonaceae bacterium]|nr:aminodeoxychorismate synthase component I [Chloroherpetonaceae bacterium]MDW8437048.1 aminodeoxychorismate synthase component I [Chloroherpetonaceae bacterium]
MTHPLCEPFSVLLESVKRDERNQRSFLFRQPRSIARANSLEEVEPAFDAMEDALRRGKWLAGFVAYEAGFAFEKKLRRLFKPSSLPLVWFGEYDAPEPFEFGENANARATIKNVQFRVSRRDYAAAIRRIIDYIQSGDVYQINFTGKLSFEFEGDWLSLYDVLRRKQPVPYAAFINLGERAVLSFSPELFFRLQNGSIESKPMKGTAARGRANAEDDAIATWLKSDEKNRAENLMILDLIRNDIGRICELGSVCVPSLFDIERFPTLFQMTSTARGKLKEGVSLKEIFRALFPCGSITGAPKIRAMDIISELEAEPRGVYTGAIGYVSPQKEACFSVAIRTLLVSQSVGEMGIGSGVTIDSAQDIEYDECLLKANFLSKPVEEFALIESIKFCGGFCLLEKHLARLKDSARYFDFRCDESEIRSRLFDYARSLDSARLYKVRVLLERSGRIEISHSLVEPLDRGERLRVAVAEKRANSADKFFYHKTTHRPLYDEASALARELGLADFLFLNERGELAEGAISNVFIERNGRLFTPPVSAGILAGVYRAFVLETHSNASERVLTLDDLLSADRIWICNAVRGMREAELAMV